MIPLRLCSPRHHVAFSVFPAATHRTGISPTSISLLCSRHAFSTQSLTECAPFLRTYHIPPLRSGSALTQAQLCCPCPLPLLPPSLSLCIFSKFSFPCGSIRFLKSAFIIGGLPIPEGQVSPEHLQTHSVRLEMPQLT